MNVYVDKNGFAHLRKSKNRFYVGQFLSEVKEAGKVNSMPPDEPKPKGRPNHPLG